jgi:hypothetical protein
MTRARVLVAAAAAVAGALSVLIAMNRGGNAESPSLGAERDQIAHVSEPGSLAAAERALEVLPGTRTTVGEFEVRGSRSIRLHTAETSDGRSCLIDEAPRTGWGSTCVARESLGPRKVLVLVSSDGGPHRFGELHVAGAAGTAVASLTLTFSDGSTADLALTPERGFLYESPARDLERDVLPVALRAYGRTGRLLQAVEFPSAR